MKRSVEKRLGILVSSNRYAGHLIQLTRTALSKGIGVSIHFIGRGCSLATEPEIVSLGEKVDFSTSREGAVDEAEQQNTLSAAVPAVSPLNLADFINSCDRMVVL